jgi:molybdenum cofactor synthesis domain-containing protein
MSRPKAAVLTVSDSVSAGRSQDLSGPAVERALEDKFQVEVHEVVPDDQPRIEAALRRLAALADLVVTTGGTGIAPRDVTPEATRSVCTRLVEGVAELMRAEGMKKTKFAALSRGLCGVCDDAIILNLPGNPQAAVDSLNAVIALLPHAIDLLHGKTEHKGAGPQGKS